MTASRLGIEPSAALTIARSPAPRHPPRPAPAAQPAAGVTMQAIVWALEAEGWVWVKSSGSHRQYRHATRPGRVTISVHAAAEGTGPRTPASVAEQSGLDLGMR